MFNSLIKDLEKEFSKNIAIELDYDKIAKEIYPYLVKLNAEKTMLSRHIENIKKTLPKQ